MRTLLILFAGALVASGCDRGASTGDEHGLSVSDTVLERDTLPTFEVPPPLQTR